MSLPVWAEFIAGSFGGERGFSAIFLPRGWGEAKSIPLLLQIIDRLDRYSDPLEDFSSPELSIERRHKPSATRGKPAGMKTVGDAPGQSAAERRESPSPSEQRLENAEKGKG